MSDEPKFMSKKRTKKMVKYYFKKKRKIKNPRLEHETVYLWFSTKAMKKFFNAYGLKIVDSGGVEVPDEDELFSGVRIYMGGYQPGAYTGKPKDSFNNAILVATHKDGEKHRDRVKDDPGKKFDTAEDNEEFGFLPDDPESGFNYSSLCPPNCNHTEHDLAHYIEDLFE